MVLRFHVLGGQDLHDDDDSREVTVITDDERPFVLYGENEQRQPSKPNDVNSGSDDSGVG